MLAAAFFSVFQDLVVNFKGDAGVFAVVGTVFLLPDLRVTFLYLVFPVDMILGVHAGKKIEAFSNIRVE
jgi:hypothetical protein